MRFPLKSLAVLVTLALTADAALASTYQFRRSSAGLVASPTSSKPSGNAGTGQVPPTTPAVTSATLSPSNVTFSSLIDVPSAAKSLTLANTGNQTLTLSTPSLTHPFTLAASSTCGTSLAASTSCTYDVVFTPTSTAVVSSDFSVQTSAGQKSATVTGSGVAADSGFAGVALLLHGDGAAGSKSFVDSSANKLSVSAAGNAQITVSAVKMGTGAMSFATSNDYLTVSNPNFAFGTRDFTIEFWMYVRSYPGGIVGGQLFGTTNGGFGGLSVNLGESPDRFRVISNGRGTWYDDVVMGSGKGCPVNTWCHMAIVRKGDALSIFKNGSVVGSATGVGTYNYQGTTAVIGRFYDGRNLVGFDGVIDDLRVTAGAARYTTSFSVPSAPYPNQ